MKKEKQNNKKKINYTQMFLKNSTAHFEFISENWRPS